MAVQGSTSTEKECHNTAKSINHKVRRQRQLNKTGYLHNDTLPALETVARQFAVAITPHMLDTIDPHNPNDPIAQQFLPDVRELESQHE